MPSPPETRASLIVRLPDPADTRAWDEFAAVYAPLVYRLARRHGLQPADADDLVQEVFSAVAQSMFSATVRPANTRDSRAKALSSPYITALSVNDPAAIGIQSGKETSSRSPA